MWYGERLDRKTRTKKNPIFSLCCGQGQVKLPMLRESPLVIKQLLYGKDEKSRYYHKNLRALNMLFSFTSLGGKVDRSIPNGVGPKTFTLQGENYHLMGSMKPDLGDSAKFSQLYIVDIESEVDDRDSIKVKKQARRKQIIEDIIKVLDDVNPYVKQFRQARERLSMEPNEKFHMRIVSNREKDEWTYDTPTASEVSALILGDFNLEMDRRDIVLQEKQTRCYDSIKQAENGGKVDMNDQGARFVLHASFTGSPRYMKNNYLDAIAIYLTDNEILGKTVAWLCLSDAEKKEGSLMEIEKILKSNGTSLSNWKKMAKPFRDVTDSQNVLILDELSYNREEFREEHDKDILKMTDEQRKIYEEIIDAVIGKRGGVFFVYGLGGTGKTFLWRLLFAAIRSRGEIVLNVASSGITSLLLQGGRTAHSRFGEERIYLSSGSIDPSDTRSVNDQALTSDFLNSIKASGLPNHNLRLKIGSPVMLLRNIDHVGGLMNGTR
uniref:ATP-dependent DNA helicase n=1 Tax=Brassica oleracea var. oleracea TaxID=109376 RepID=A0A0D3BGQ9_BRAOL